MAAKKYLLEWEVTLKLHSGLHHEKLYVKADSFDEGLRKATTACIYVAKKMQGVILAMCLTESEIEWQPAVPAIDIAN